MSKTVIHFYDKSYISNKKKFFLFISEIKRVNQYIGSVYLCWPVKWIQSMLNEKELMMQQKTN